MFCVLGFIMPRKKEIGVPIGRNMSEGPIKDVLRRIGEEKFTAIEKKDLNYCVVQAGRFIVVLLVEEFG